MNGYKSFNCELLRRVEKPAKVWGAIYAFSPGNLLSWYPLGRYIQKAEDKRNIVIKFADDEMGNPVDMLEEYMQQKESKLYDSMLFTP